MSLTLSLPAWGVWIEIELTEQQEKEMRSLPAWGVWIEIDIIAAVNPSYCVTPRMGSVD